MKKHFHITLHFTVEADASKLPTPKDEGDAEFIARQKRLLDMLLSDDKSASTLAVYEMACWLGTEMWDDRQWLEEFFHIDIEPGPDEFGLEDILKPTIAKLSTEDQQWFTEVKEEEIFYENTEEFQECFSTELDHVEIVEVKMRQEP